MIKENRYDPTGLLKGPPSSPHDFKQEVYGVVSLYMDALSPMEISTALKEVSDEEAKRSI